MKESQRRDFLRKIPLALLSVSALSFLGFRRKEEQPAIRVNSLSKHEADELIRSNNFRVIKNVKPSPPPAQK